MGRVKDFLRPWYWLVRFDIPGHIFGCARDEFEIKRRFRATFGREIDLKNPQTLNEKIQWLKLYERNDFQTMCADKYAVRDYWKQFGEESLIPLLFHTTDWREITYENLPDEPCIVKLNTGSGCYEIVRDKSHVNFNALRRKCRNWMMCNYYYRSQEWQYKNIKPRILVERLLQTGGGTIPNDYKLNYINGELQFVYCSIDREGENYRSVYSPDWKRMELEWVAAKDHKGALYGKDIPQPPSFERMKEIGAQIARNFKLVRVDFYDVDGKLYYGEITLHHGSGFDTFVPEHWDLDFGKLLKL